MAVKISKQQKLDTITNHLIGVNDGGYAGDYVWIGNVMAYTGSRGGSGGDIKHDSTLSTITKREILDWFDRAMASWNDPDNWEGDVDDGPFCDEYGCPTREFSEALYETHIEQKPQ